MREDPQNISEACVLSLKWGRPSSKYLRLNRKHCNKDSFLIPFKTSFDKNTFILQASSLQREKYIDADRKLAFIFLLLCISGITWPWAALFNTGNILNSSFRLRKQRNKRPCKGLFWKISIDVAGPQPTTPRSNKYIFVAVEPLSGWPTDRLSMRWQVLPDQLELSTPRKFTLVVFSWWKWENISALRRFGHSKPN